MTSLSFFVAVLGLTLVECASTAVPLDAAPSDVAGTGLLSLEIETYQPDFIPGPISSHGWTVTATPYSPQDLLEERQFGPCLLRRSSVPPTCIPDQRLQVRIDGQIRAVPQDSRGCPYHSLNIGTANAVPEGAMVGFESSAGPFGDFALAGALQAHTSIQAPLPDRSGTVIAPRGGDLGVRWTGSTPTFAVLLFGTSSTPPIESRRAYCVFDGSSGAASVPSAVVDFLDGIPTGITVSAVDQSSTVSGNWRVELRVTRTALAAPLRRP